MSEEPVNILSVNDVFRFNRAVLQVAVSELSPLILHPSRVGSYEKFHDSNGDHTERESTSSSESNFVKPSLMKCCWLAVLAVGCSISTATSAEPLPAVDQRFAGDTNESPSFQRHVIPLVGRLGCNGRACHGSFQGQGGFQLSLFGYDFAADHKAITGGKDELRVELKNPTASLVLAKPTLTVDHDGGKRMEVDGWEYRLLRAWIQAGAKRDPEELTLLKLEMTPPRIVFGKPGEAVSLKVVAEWSNGQREDVTPLCRFSTNDDNMARVSAAGQVTAAGAGDTHLIVFYDNDVQAVSVLMPVSDLAGPRYPQVVTANRVDELVVEKLRVLGIVPSELCNDFEFLRRASLDIAGTLPTPREVELFIADSAADKRSQKIDELLTSPAHAAWWSNKLLDHMGNHARIGANNIFRDGQHVFHRLWNQWLTQRLADNMPYDQLVERLVLANSRLPGQSYEDYCQEMCSYLRPDNPADIRTRASVSFLWEVHITNKNKSEENALQFAHAFLGLRIQCAQCHKHPFDQWRKEDFEQFTGFFGRLTSGYADDAAVAKAKEMTEALELTDKSGNGSLRSREVLIRDGKVVPLYETFSNRDGKQKGGKAGIFAAKPKSSGRTFSLRVLGGVRLDDDQDDPRVPLMEWLKSPENPYFAKAFVNRVWAGYFHAGIVNPPDDMNLANPPSNGPLLDYLAEGFIQHGYDMRWVHRQIVSSRTYQLSSKPNETNRNDLRNFSRNVPRRLPAEVLYDAIVQASAAKPGGIRDDLAERALIAEPHYGGGSPRDMKYALQLFGKPQRRQICDCERSAAPNLLQSVFLQNDADVTDLLHRKNGWLAQLPAATDREPLIRELYLRTLSREPSEPELKRCLQHLTDSTDLKTAMQELLLALINTREFITIR